MLNALKHGFSHVLKSSNFATVVFIEETCACDRDLTIKELKGIAPLAKKI